jgi:prepilin-type N-terminal cleavage/methylation domain-containing protein
MNARDPMWRGDGGEAAHPRKGFTLVELMAAMSVTSLIVLVMVSISGVALDTWSRSRSEVRAFMGWRRFQFAEPAGNSGVS